PRSVIREYSECCGENACCACGRRRRLRWLAPVTLAWLAAAVSLSPLAVASVAAGRPQALAEEVLRTLPQGERPPRPIDPTRSFSGDSADPVAANPVDNPVERDAKQESDNASVDLPSPAESGRGEAVRELSLPPGRAPLLPADRPAWVGAPPDYTTSVHRLVVGSLVTQDAQQADALLDEPLESAVLEYVDEVLFPQSRASAALRSKVSAAYIRKNLIDHPQGYVARMNAGSEAMYQKWVQLTITAQQRAQMQDWYRQAVQRRRLAPLGLGLVGVLGVVGLANLALRRTVRKSSNLPPEKLP
ncbi:MAG: hypothetical protein KDA45_03980, partial [Planctomycetales bacterium]|nr:hypothetical protein [Planctomycetales bacterium]